MDRLGLLVHTLLDVSRVTAGRFVLDLESVDLAEVTGEVLERMADELAQAGCALHLECPAPVRGRWDRGRLEQVVTNLVSNACKYGAGHPVTVSVAQQGRTARLAVRDGGIGITGADLERIFERFERAAGARDYAGLGLGLYITRQIVQAHGGTIRAESERARGSCFTVELPLEPPGG